MSKPDERLMDGIGRVIDQVYDEGSIHSNPRLLNRDLCSRTVKALIEHGLLVPSDHADAAVAAALEQAAQHYLRQDMDNQCNCGWKADDSCDSWDDQYAQWQQHIRSLATPAQRNALREAQASVAAFKDQLVELFRLRPDYPAAKLIESLPSDSSALDAERQRVRLEEAERWEQCTAHNCRPKFKAGTGCWICERIAELRVRGTGGTT